MGSICSSLAATASPDQSRSRLIAERAPERVGRPLGRAADVRKPAPPRQVRSRAALRGPQGTPRGEAREPDDAVTARVYSCDV
jgi:hypothetical protein